MRKQYKFIKHSKTISRLNFATKPNHAFSKFASVSRANFENTAKLTDTKTLKPADIESATTK